MKTLTIPPPADAPLSRRALAGVREETLALPFDGAPVEPQAIREAVAFFAETPRSEEAFYVRFGALDRAGRAALERHWLIDDDWTLFRRVCAAYGLRRRR